VAYEKAGEVIEDEFKRKVRMNRTILMAILPDIRILNVFKYKWFSYFYFGHRTCRYLLWIAHLIVLLSNALLLANSKFYLLTFIGTVTRTKNKYVSLIYYYTVTIIAQWFGVYNIVTGRAKPFWEKAESTRYF